MLDDVRRRLRKGAFGVGSLAVVVGVSGSSDVAFGLGFVAVALLLIDEKLTTSTWLPWGGW
ncbi:hypothetical protein C453_12816 [Haloferax elongans ATCC BAA-1513]|uniref:Uncharacterized protein n=1 Tax=Haloferax elongans ATCC BAA-1513 TaxID=1230453 RepID=M0HKV8_HALEO|nr:hypothetical protein [Haloferax elongans]ELZ84428.1 hypothetical protein C453_12816 [Haloferax elongans ATCC BAA-1513]